MPYYKCTTAAKVWRDGIQVGGEIDSVLDGAIVTAARISDALYITTGTRNGLRGWSRPGWFQLIESTEPDPEPPPPGPDPVPPPTDTDADLYQFLPDLDMSPNASNPRKWSIDHGVGAPDVLPLADRSMIFTPPWQAFVRAINPNMTVNHVNALYGPSKAYFNRQSDNPGANYIMPKTFTSGWACHEGIVSGNELIVHTLDGNASPPDIAKVNPQTRPHLFFHATIVRIRNGREARYPFPNGKPAWGYSGNYIFMPFTSRFELRVPLSKVKKVSEYILPYT